MRQTPPRGRGTKSATAGAARLQAGGPVRTSTMSAGSAVRGLPLPQLRASAVRPCAAATLSHPSPAWGGVGGACFGRGTTTLLADIAVAAGAATKARAAATFEAQLNPRPPPRHLRAGLSHSSRRSGATSAPAPACGTHGRPRAQRCILAAPGRWRVRVHSRIASPPRRSSGRSCSLAHCLLASPTVIHLQPHAPTSTRRPPSHIRAAATLV